MAFNHISSQKDTEAINDNKPRAPLTLMSLT